MIWGVMENSKDLLFLLLLKVGFQLLLYSQARKPFWLAPCYLSNRPPHRLKDTHPIIIDLLEGLVADGSLENNTLESVAFVTGHQLHANHLAFSYCHVTKYLRRHPNKSKEKINSGRETQGHLSLPMAKSQMKNWDLTAQQESITRKPNSQ